jgi:DNA-binding beta-propeller fold protein YncE
MITANTTVEVMVKAVPTITWATPSAITYGTPLSASQLDASSTVSGSFTYTPALGTVLAAGTYTLMATFTPADTDDYTTATAYQSLVVTTQNVWIVNSVGSLGELSNNGTALTSAPISGGGRGIAIDGAGSLWSIDVGGGSVTKFSNTGASVTSFNGGINSATALAIDGAGQLWVANGNNSISALSSAGAIVSSTSDPSVSGPTGVAIDISGNVWISNGITSTVDEIVGGAAPVAPLATAVQDNTLGVKP